MREIKFRAKSKDIQRNGGKWIYGNLIHYSDSCHTILWDDGIYRSQVQVESETEGQFTGMRDAHGKDIYEGDVLRVYDKGKSDGKGVLDVVRYDPCHAQFIFGDVVCHSNNFLSIEETFNKDVEVVGNVYDNPELLED